MHVFCERERERERVRVRDILGAIDIRVYCVYVREREKERDIEEDILRARDIRDYFVKERETHTHTHTQREREILKAIDIRMHCVCTREKRERVREILDVFERERER